MTRILAFTNGMSGDTEFTKSGDKKVINIRKIKQKIIQLIFGHISNFIVHYHKKKPVLKETIMIINGLINTGQSSPASKRQNEDWLAYGKNFAAVLDGATFKGSSIIAKDAFTDAAWCSQTAGDLLSSLMAQTQNPETLFRLLCMKLSHAYQSITQQDPMVIEYAKRPSTTLSCAIIMGDYLRLIQIGDSPILVEFNTGEVNAFLGDKVLLDHDNDIRNDLKQLWDQNPNSTFDIIQQMQRVETIRHRMNHDNGYGVLTIAPPTVLNMTVKEYDVRSIKHVVLMTDGLLELYDTFNVYPDLTAFMHKATQPKGLQEMLLTLRQVQNNDPECRQFPRGKIGDDVTALLIRPNSP